MKQFFILIPKYTNYKDKKYVNILPINNMKHLLQMNMKHLIINKHEQKLQKYNLKQVKLQQNSIYIIKGKIFSQRNQPQSYDFVQIKFKMIELNGPRVAKLLRNSRILILMFPLLTMIKSVDQLIVQTGNFIVVITLMILTYLGHEYHFDSYEKQSNKFRHIILQQLRKITLCIFSSYLIALLISEVYNITVNVYTVAYGQEIVFWFRVIVTLSNVEANLQLCDKKHRKHHKSSD